jgi:hypothetical protein
MKSFSSFFLGTALFVAPAFGWAQGLVNFNNHVPDADPPVDAPVFDKDGTTRLGGNNFLAQLFGGPTETNLAPAGPPLPFLTGDGAGYFGTGESNHYAVRAIPGVPPGGTAFVQVRAWDRLAGGSYEQAKANGGRYGASTLFTVVTGGAGDPPTPPAHLSDLTSFQLVQDAPVAPTIIRQPQSQTVLAGSNATFRVEATGTPPLRFQWRKNGESLAHGTNPVLRLVRVQPADAGSYDVVVSNDAGSATSDAATLTVKEPTPVAPRILQQPRSASVLVGANVAFSVYAEGTRPLRYQWLHDGNPVEGGTNSVLWLRNVQLADAGNYAVVVSNVAGSATSSNATLTVNSPPVVAPTIVGQPRSLTVPVGGRAQFNVYAEGSRPLRYQWRKDGADLERATNAAYVIERVQTSHAGVYDVVVSNAAGSVTSDPATLTVTNPPLVPPTILSQPVSVTVPQGSNAYFRVMAQGSPPLTFQWRFNGNPLERGTNPVLKIEAAQPENAGTYDVVVSNPVGSVTSAPATLTVVTNPPPPPPPPPTNYPPVIRQQPRSLLVPEGGRACFAVYAEGSPPLRFQWRHDGAAISFGTNPVLCLENVRPENAGVYDVVVSNPAGSVTSAPATLTVTNAPPPPPPPTNYPPVITQQPRSQEVPVGANVAFGVQVSGTPPFQFQWRRNGSPIPPGTNATLWLNNVQLEHAGTYDVVVRNIAGEVISAPATLTVTNRPPPPPPTNYPPVITEQPRSQTVNAGANVAFGVLASGTPPLRFQWRKDGANLANKTNATLYLNNVQTNQSGIYDVVVSNGAGSVTSAPATLTVNPPPPPQPPTIIRQPVSQTVLAGTNVAFRVEAAGSLPLKFQWRHEGTNIPWGTNPTLWLERVTAAHAGGYQCVVSNAVGVATSDTATLTVVAP